MPDPWWMDPDDDRDEDEGAEDLYYPEPPEPFVPDFKNGLDDDEYDRMVSGLCFGIQ